MDQDFQERMFARQMAVMKGQAWNVVETLKTPDHGPLELTRRPKVCVWDDLVDVPVAVPMRVASAEMRRRATAESESAAAVAHTKANSGIIAEEEMDIGAVNTSQSHAASAPPTSGTGPVVDLLGITSPPADLPHPGRFELALADDLPSPSPLSNGALPSSEDNRPDTSSSKPTRPHFSRAAHSHRSLNVYSPDRGPAGRSDTNTEHHHHRPKTRFSFTAPASSRRESASISIAAQLFGNSSGNVNSSNNRRASRDYYGDEYEDGEEGREGDGEVDAEEEELEGGDLGYAAATGMEGNRRKVIVERLEMVKGRNPVFTWC